MRINVIALLWLAIGVFPVIGGFDLFPRFSGNLPVLEDKNPPTLDGKVTNITANGGTLSVPDGDK